ncbi:TauD/TfdA family dioxygenase [Nostoc sp. ChiSLP03a]|uniref:TauD/TfdA family dioxygenase n=1 Tax=Nostoc sp. ChiSLP03a TaxID=3075380 RepID=UPI002AD36D8D|nr:TauD/TfdA family dioxygenase [Nostoc sp. ChiSLP03a]MDZ8210086.1 TauD/TfdA family dioxygenase [Nostoc sp. ChiSLP03a]
MKRKVDLSDNNSSNVYISKDISISEIPSSLWTKNFFETRQKELQEYGWVYLSGLPADFQWIGYTQHLTQTCLMPQDNNEYIYDVKFAPSNEKLSDSKSQNELRPHTEAPYLKIPPKYLALWCVQPSSCGKGYTTFVDSKELLRNLTIEEQQKLMKYGCSFVSKDTTHSIIAPMLQFIQLNQLMLRFSYNVLVYGEPSPDMTKKASVSDQFLKNICDLVLEFFNNNHVSLRMEKHSLLIMDNHRVLHSRTQYSDTVRHLQRIWLI